MNACAASSSSSFLALSAHRYGGSYVIGIGGGLALLIVFFSAHSRRLWLYLTVGTTVAFGFLAFPLYRVAAGIEFFFPNADALMLMHAHYVNWDLDERSRRAIEHVVLDTSILRKLSTSDGQVEYHDVVEMVDAFSPIPKRPPRDRLLSTAVRLRATKPRGVQRAKIHLTIVGELLCS